MAESKPVLNHNLLNRVFLEAVEIAFQECAEDRTNFGESKVSYVINSLVPSGYVLGTSYWFLYMDRKRGGKFFCVCQRFGSSCRHKVDDKLTTDYTDYGELYYFPSLKKGFVVPVNVRIEINQHDDNVVVTVLMDQLELELLDETAGTLNAIDEVKPVKPMYFSFRILEPKGPLLESFSLIPHPYTSFRYGRMIPQLRKRLSKISYCKNRLDVTDDYVQKCTVMPTELRYKIPEEVYAMAPISQEIFKGQMHIQATHTYIPTDHKDSNYDFVNCRQGELVGTRHWKFMKSMTKAMLSKIETGDDPSETTAETPSYIMTDDLPAMMAYKLHKDNHIIGGTVMSVVDEFPNITLADVSDAIGTTRIKPILVIDEPIEYLPPNEEMPKDSPVLLKLYREYRKGTSNTKDNECNTFTITATPPPNRDLDYRDNNASSSC